MNCYVLTFSQTRIKQGRNCNHLLAVWGVMLVEVAVVVVVVVVLVYHFNKDPAGLPPGPPRYPVIGCLAQPNNIQDCKMLQKKYGNTFSCRAGSETLVTTCDYKMIKEAFSKYEFIDRPDWKFLNFLSDGKMAGVVLRNGAPWQTLRRFLLRQLRDMGMGKSRLDDAILREADELVKDFHNYTHGPALFPPSINIAILNVIWQLVASRRYDINDEEILKFSNLVKKFQDDISLLALPEFFPWLRYLPDAFVRKLCREDDARASAEIGRLLMEETVKEHRASLNPASPRDVLDEFLLEMENQKDDPHSVFNEQDLIKTIFDLFTAGYDTSANTLRWFLLHMIHQPEVQQRVQREIDQVVARDTLPSHTHRQHLPYLDATINEVLRVSSLVPGGVPHAAVNDTYLDQYFIPKGTAVSGHIGFCHFDPNYWNEPQEFRPERFLNESGKLKVPKEGFLPFGTGKRSCLGEPLARMELYIFSAALLQNFTFGVPEGRTVDLAPRPLANSDLPKDQKIVIKPRN